MLKRDPKKRPTINEALKDEWIQSNINKKRKGEEMIMTNLLE